MTLTDIAATARNTYMADVWEHDVLRAICKNPAIVASIASGQNVDNVLSSNMPALMSVIGASIKTSAPAAAGAASGGDILTDDLLEDVAKMVAIMAKGFDGQKLRGYINDHPDIRQGVDAVAPDGASAVKSYLMKKVPDIAISYMKGN